MLASTITLLATLAIAFAAPVVEERQFTWGGYDWTKGIGSSNPTTGSSGGCPAYEIISARGTTESQVAPYGNTATVNGIINAVGGNSARYEVVYAGKKAVFPMQIFEALTTTMGVTISGHKLCNRSCYRSR